MKRYTFILALGLSLGGWSCSNSCKEVPVEDCMCTAEYDPVCGCNNKTYSNACKANCAGIKDYTKGECK